jgi:hypothetical protein
VTTTVPDPTVTTGTPTPDAAPTTPLVAPTTPVPAVTTPLAAPTTQAPTTPPPADDGDPEITLPTALPTDLIPGLPKERLALSQRCVTGGVEWTVTNISKKATGYAWLDTNLAWGIHVLAPGQSAHLAKGFAVLVIPLSAKTGLPINLPLIDISHCGGSFPGGKATVPPVGQLPISLGGGSGTTPTAATLPVATEATPVVTNNIHFTG